MNLNVTDLRRKRRRSPKNQTPVEKEVKGERRKASDRRVLPAKAVDDDENAQRIWLTPGERTLIEDLYLLEDGEKKTE
jgi:hypothetical protein